MGRAPTGRSPTKYYVDELYNATVISGTFASGRGLWAFDRKVVDGAVNGSSWLTLVSSWLSGLTDRTVVDGLVNLVGRTCEEASFWFRKLQTGLVQNYALLMLFGVFAFVSIYLFRGEVESACGHAERLARTSIGET